MQAAEIEVGRGFHCQRLADGSVQLRVASERDGLTLRRVRLSPEQWRELVHALAPEEQPCLAR